MLAKKECFILALKCQCSLLSLSTRFSNLTSKLLHENIFLMPLVRAWLTLQIVFTWKERKKTFHLSGLIKILLENIRVVEKLVGYYPKTHNANIFLFSYSVILNIFVNVPR